MCKCFSNRCKRCSGGCLKFIALILFLLSVGLLVVSIVTFKSLDKKFTAGKYSKVLSVEGNAIAE